MSRVTRKLQQRYEVLTGQARELASRGVHEEADSCLQEALGVARQLAEAGEDAGRRQAEIDALRASWSSPRAMVRRRSSTWRMR